MNCLSRKTKFKNKEPAWSDPQDKGKLIETPTQIDDDDERERSDLSSDDSDVDLYAGDLHSRKISLKTKNLPFKHLVNLNNECGYKGSVQQVEFNPKSKIALVTLSYGQADLYEVDGERNRYIQNIKIPSTQKPFCLFRSDGNSIILSSERYKGTLYTYDLKSSTVSSFTLRVGKTQKEVTDFTLFGDHMACRKDGSPELLILTPKTFEIKTSIRLNEPASAVQFHGEHKLLIAGENAQVYEWDLRRGAICTHKFIDEGNVHISSLALSNNLKQLAIGSNCGIVNLYELNECLKSKYPKPMKTLSNLKNSCDILKYNHSGELLLVGSSEASGAFRMVYSLNGSVYRNFPAQGKKYSHLINAAFSPNDGYLGLGSTNGRAYLCRLPYYNSY